jgi:hypothetical protein
MADTGVFEWRWTGQEDRPFAQDRAARLLCILSASFVSLDNRVAKKSGITFFANRRRTARAVCGPECRWLAMRRPIDGNVDGHTDTFDARPGLATDIAGPSVLPPGRSALAVTFRSVLALALVRVAVRVRIGRIWLSQALATAAPAAN